MTKGDFLKATEQFSDDVELLLWCSGARHYMDTVVHEVTEDGRIDHLVLQPGPVRPNSAPRRATPLFGARGE
jgi:hypothetical protein